MESKIRASSLRIIDDCRFNAAMRPGRAIRLSR
jgi:hypothetical protein